MKRILIAIVATAFIASAANAAYNVQVDVDSTSYAVGDNVTVNLTLTTVGNHTLGAFGTLEFTTTWDSGALQMANGNIPANYGTGSQTLFAGLSGSTTPSCPNTGTTCFPLSQLNAGFGNVDVNGVVTGQLVLQVTGGAGSLLSSVLTQLAASSGSSAPDSIVVGPNYGVATIVPEPTTAVLLGLGLVGLGVAGRRR